MALTREDILAMVDINHKELTVPDTIPTWGGQKIFIRQLSRGDQDMYLKRKFFDSKMINGNVEASMVGLYGNDSWICSRGICDSTGTIMFTPADVEELDKKAGEFIGWVASEILKFSNMLGDAKVAKKLGRALRNEELKN
jgi:hypothetical protein